MFCFEKGTLLRFACVFCALAILFSMVTVSATQTTENVPYNSYSFWDGYANKKAVADRAVYEVSETIDAKKLGIDALSDIQDICYGRDGLIYLLDSTNGRIIVLNPDYTLNRVIDKFYLDGEESPLNLPQGIFVEKDGHFYVADTENMRLLYCESDGRIAKVIVCPKSDIIPDDFDYYPMKVIRDNKGFTYLLTRGSYYGAMVFDSNDKFTGFYGSNLVQTGVIASVARAFKRMFTSNTKLKNQAQKLPYQFMDLCVDTEDFMYTVSPNTASRVGQVRKVSPGGSSILRRIINFQSENSDAYNWGEPTLYRLPTSKKLEQNISGLSVDNEGYMYVLDKAYGTIYIYDSTCRSVTCFGGGYGIGSQQGTFSKPIAIEVVSGNILVSDFDKQNITVFSRTEYGEKLFTANNMTLNGEYSNSKELWNQVMKMSKSSQLAYRGLTKAAMSEDRLDEAMQYAKLGLDQKSYSIVFEQAMNKYIENNLWWIFIVVALLIAFGVVLWYFLKKHGIVIFKNLKLRNALGVLLHPIETFDNVKRRNMGSVPLALTFIMLLFVLRVAGQLWGGFMYVIPDADNVNSLMIFAGTAGLAFLWVIINWLVASLVEGKGSFKDILIVTGYSMLPLIIYYAVFLVLSHVLIPGNIDFLDILQTIALIAMMVFMLLGHMQVHDMDLKKVLKSSIITILGMGLAVFIIFVIYTLIQSFVGFIVNVVSEVAIR